MHSNIPEVALTLERRRVIGQQLQQASSKPAGDFPNIGICFCEIFPKPSGRTCILCAAALPIFPGSGSTSNKTFSEPQTILVTIVTIQTHSRHRKTCTVLLSCHSGLQYFSPGSLSVPVLQAFVASCTPQPSRSSGGSEAWP